MVWPAESRPSFQPLFSWRPLNVYSSYHTASVSRHKSLILALQDASVDTFQTNKSLQTAILQCLEIVLRHKIPIRLAAGVKTNTYRQKVQKQKTEKSYLIA